MRKICNICGKTFEQNQEVVNTNMAYVVGYDSQNERCYHCALEEITGILAPEEGDFTSARLISGQISDQEWEWFQEDLRDHLHRYPETSDEERYPERYRCHYCNRADCSCDRYEPEPVQDEDFDSVESYFCMTCGTSVSGSDLICDTCDTRFNQSQCMCCKNIISNDKIICAECDEQFARDRLACVLTFYIFSGYWRQNFLDFIRGDLLYWIKRLWR